MANTTIPNLPAATSLDGTEQLELVQNGTSKRVTADQIAALAENTQGTVTQINTGGALVGGPITTTGTISLPPDAVTNQYLAEMPANTLKANITGLTANPTDITPSQLLDTFSSAEGAMLYRGVSGWQELAPGSNNQYMYTNGNNPQWVTLAINPGDIGPSGVTPGSYGSASQTITFTVISGGLLTAAAAVPIAISNSQVSGLGTMSTQNANSVAITGGNIDGTIIGATTPAAGYFTSVTTNSLSGLTTPIPAASGGTGLSSYTTGDILYATSSSTLGRLNDVATGNVLLSGGVGVAPAYGKVGLTTHVDGILPVTNGGTGATSLTGYVKGNGTSAMTASATIPNSDLQNSTIQIGSTSIALGASSLTLAGLTSVTLTQDPTTALQASTKQYVDNQVAIVSNVTYHTQVEAASTANLNATYNNGTGGVGATLTNAGAFAQFQIDTYTPGSLARVLIKDQTNPAQNGIYEVTTQGDAISVPWVLTRTSDFNAPGSGPNFIQTGASVFVQFGNTEGSTSWVMTTTGTITVGTTALNWTQSSSSGNILVNAPLSKAGNTISLGTVTVANGGTGLTSYTIGDLLYADSGSSLARLADVATGNVLRSGGVGVAPAWGQVTLTTDVTGTLPVANGGTGTATAFTQGSVVFAGASGTYSQNASNFFWDNVNTRLGIHTNAPDATLTVMSETQTAIPPGALPAGTDVHVIGANNAETRITQDAFGTGNYPAFTGRHSRGTAASPTATQADDVLSQFTGRGYGTSTYNSASTGILQFAAAENFTNTDQGTYASFHLTATGAAPPAEVLRIGPVGQIGVGGSSYGSAGQILTSGGASVAPSWTSGSSIAVGTATNLAGGAGGSVPYQSGASTTTFLSIGAANTVMTSTGSAPQWVTSLTGLTGVSSSGLTNTSLTPDRVIYSTTGGVQTDSANLTFNGTTLTANDITDSSLTAGRITYAGVGGNLVDSAGLTFDGTNFTTTGTASATKFIPTGGTATGNGMYLATTNVVAFSTDGSERVRIDATGFVGINQNNPGSALDVKGTLRLSGSTSGYVGISPAAAAGSTTYTLPSADGTAGFVLSTNGSGTLSWAAAGGLPTMNIVTGTTQTATAGNQYVLTNAAATTVTLPASPAAGDTVYVTVGNSLITNVVARNGNNIQGLAEDLTLNAQYASVQLRYADATEGWVLT